MRLTTVAKNEANSASVRPSGSSTPSRTWRPMSWPILCTAASTSFWPSSPRRASAGLEHLEERHRLHRAPLPERRRVEVGSWPRTSRLEALEALRVWLIEAEFLPARCVVAVLPVRHGGDDSRGRFRPLPPSGLLCAHHEHSKVVVSARCSQRRSSPPHRSPSSGNARRTRASGENATPEKSGAPTESAGARRQRVGVGQRVRRGGAAPADAVRRASRPRPRASAR